jgi:hypothetical protein
MRGLFTDGPMAARILCGSQNFRADALPPPLGRGDGSMAQPRAGQPARLAVMAEKLGYSSLLP